MELQHEDAIATVRQDPRRDGQNRPDPAIGSTSWVVAVARGPRRARQAPGRLPRPLNHDADDHAIIVNAGPRDATVAVTLMFETDPPAGPYDVPVPARSIRHLELATLAGQPADGPDFCAVVTSTEPVVVQRVLHAKNWGEDGRVYVPAFAAPAPTS